MVTVNQPQIKDKEAEEHKQINQRNSAKNELFTVVKQTETNLAKKSKTKKSLCSQRKYSSRYRKVCLLFLKYCLAYNFEAIVIIYFN